MALQDSTKIECNGLNHMDFTADGKYAIATCEFSSLYETILSKVF